MKISGGVDREEDSQKLQDNIDQMARWTEQRHAGFNHDLMQGKEVCKD